MSKDFKVIIQEPGRAAEFESIFGRKEVCVLSPLPEWTMLAGVDELVQVYYLDFRQVSATEKYRLVNHIAAKVGVHPNEVEAALNDNGLPILAKDCIVVIDNPQRWID